MSMSDLDTLDFIFNPVIQATTNPFTIEKVSVRKISGEIITDKDTFTVNLFHLDCPIIEKIVEISPTFTFRMGNYNIINLLIFLSKKNQLTKELDLDPDQFYMISHQTDRKLKRFGIDLSPKRYIDIDSVIIIGSCQQLVIGESHDQIWFDKGKFKTIKLS
jgi:hypothetical protein